MPKKEKKFDTKYCLRSDIYKIFCQKYLLAGIYAVRPWTQEITRAVIETANKRAMLLWNGEQ